ncbi:acetylcholinesterase-1-like [Haemaphysalis longicornis]
MTLRWVEDTGRVPVYPSWKPRTQAAGAGTRPQSSISIKLTCEAELRRRPGRVPLKMCWFFFVLLAGSALLLFVFLIAKRAGSHHVGAPASANDHRTYRVPPSPEEIPHVELHVSGRIYSGRAIAVGRRRLHGFFGIAYAKQPVGSRRFHYPVPLGTPPRTAPGTLGPLIMARRKRFPCPQNLPWNSEREPTLDVNVSESCLHLNVWAPADGNRDRTVMVFLHGGGFQSGSNDQPVNDGRLLCAEGDVVVVVPNYRLNAFGFLNGQVPDAPGNMGLHDVILALRWVKHNIAHFGGNPNRITLVGREAGAVLAGYVMVSPLARGLVRRYILLSGSPFRRLPDNRGPRSVENLRTLANRLKCSRSETVLDSVQCLAKVDLYNYVDLQDLASFRMYPSDKDYALPFAVPAGLADAATYSAEEVLLANELGVGESLVAPLKATPLSDVLKRSIRMFGSMLLKRFGFDDTGEAMKAFDVYSASSRSSAFSELVGDIVVRCPLQFLADELARRSRRVFYTLLRRDPSWPEVEDAPFDQSLVFGLPLELPSVPPDLSTLTKRVIYTFTTFAKTG